MKTIFFLLLFVSSLFAQSPPVSPYPTGTPCAWQTGTQLGDYQVDCAPPFCIGQNWRFDPSECWLAAYCSSADARSILGGFVGTAVGIGGTCYWQCANMQPGTTPHSLGTASVFIVLANWSYGSQTGTLPGADANWDQVFGYNQVVAWPTYTFNQTSGGYTFDSWILDMPIPNNTALIGAYIQAQGARFDGIDSQFYLSTAMLMQIWS